MSPLHLLSPHFCAFHLLSPLSIRRAHGLAASYYLPAVGVCLCCCTDGDECGVETNAERMSDPPTTPYTPVSSFSSVTLVLNALLLSESIELQARRSKWNYRALAFFFFEAFSASRRACPSPRVVDESAGLGVLMEHDSGFLSQHVTNHVDASLA